jgi:hypothetical protein
MAILRTANVARSSSAANPISQSVVITARDKVVVLLLNVIGSSVRSGGSPSFGGEPMTQASTQQIAASTPEASAEIWYVLNPNPGTYTLSIPNAGTNTIKYTVETGQPRLGSRVALDAANGANATSTNPNPGAITISETGTVAWAVVASGAQTWAPSAQAGAIIANTDDGTTGGGEQSAEGSNIGSLTLSWTFGTSEDYGAVVVAFKEILPHNIENYKGVRADGNVCVTMSKIR